MVQTRNTMHRGASDLVGRACPVVSVALSGRGVAFVAFPSSSVADASVVTASLAVSAESASVAPLASAPFAYGPSAMPPSGLEATTSVTHLCFARLRL